PLGGGMTGRLGDPPYVWTIVVASNTTFAGGAFDYSDGLTVNSVAKWDGTSWSPLQNGFYLGYVYALTFRGDTLFAGGDMAYLGRWSGSNWVADVTVNNSIL